MERDIVIIVPCLLVMFVKALSSVSIKIKIEKNRFILDVSTK